ncbi:MAG: tetratricopeptide repeat protein [Proteobacteria bacterium]|nr:tetratricopeptide repeat protein [Pseudomonadota bacterium]
MTPRAAAAALALVLCAPAARAAEGMKLGYWANFVRGSDALEREDHAAAAAEFEEALRDKPEGGEARVALAIARLHLGDTAGAVAACKGHEAYLPCRDSLAISYFLNREWAASNEEGLFVAALGWRENFKYFGWSWLAHAHEGRRAFADESARLHLSHMKPGQSPAYALERFLLGEVGEDAFLDGFKGANRADSALGLTIAAEKRLLGGDKTGAKLLFQKTRAFCGATAACLVAEVELRRLGP